MTTVISERIEFNPETTPGKTLGSKCLCPDWMCWMPWLADGEDVRAATKKKPGKYRTARHQPAVMKGL